MTARWIETHLPFRRIAMTIKACVLERKLTIADDDITAAMANLGYVCKRRDRIKQRLGALRHELARERVS